MTWPPPAGKSTVEILAADARRQAESDAALERVRVFAGGWHENGNRNQIICHLREGVTLTIDDLRAVLDRLDDAEDERDFLRPRATEH